MKRMTERAPRNAAAIDPVEALRVEPGKGLTQTRRGLSMSSRVRLLIGGVVLAAVVVATGVYAQGQGPRGRGPGGSPFPGLQSLDLTDAQKDQVREITERHRQQMQDEIYAVLTPDQRVQADKRKADAQARAKQRQQRLRQRLRQK